MYRGLNSFVDLFKMKELLNNKRVVDVCRMASSDIINQDSSPDFSRISHWWF